VKISLSTAYNEAEVSFNKQTDILQESTSDQLINNQNITKNGTITHCHQSAQQQLLNNSMFIACMQACREAESKLPWALPTLKSIFPKRGVSE